MEMDTVEKMILSIFKNSNSERGFPNLDLQDFNLQTDSTQSAKKDGEKGKEKIFSFVKIPKEKKKEIEMMKQNNFSFSNPNNTINFNNNVQNMNFYNNYQYKPNNYNYMNGYYPYSYLNGYDQAYSNNQVDTFINTCLDSNNPDDLTKLLMFFSENKNYTPYQYYYSNQANKEKEMYNTLKRYVSESYSTTNTTSNNNESDSAKAQNENNEKPQNEIKKNEDNYIVNMISDTTPNKEFSYPQHNLYNTQYYNFANYANPLYTQYMLNQYSTQMNNVNTI